MPKKASLLCFNLQRFWPCVCWKAVQPHPTAQLCSYKRNQTEKLKKTQTTGNMKFKKIKGGK